MVSSLFDTSVLLICSVSFVTFRCVSINPRAVCAVVLAQNCILWNGFSIDFLWTLCVNTENKSDTAEVSATKNTRNGPFLHPTVDVILAKIHLLLLLILYTGSDLASCLINSWAFCHTPRICNLINLGAFVH